MPAHPISREIAQATIAAVEDAMRQGHKPPGTFLSGHETGAIKAAADALNSSHSVVSNRLKQAKRLYKLEPDKSVYREVAKAVPEPAEQLEKRRILDRLQQEATLRRAAERHALADKTLREAVFGLAADPLQPPSWPAADKSRKTKEAEAIVVFLSDIHMGEVIDLDMMGGRNSYNMHIAEKRLQRLFQGVVKMGTEHWTGPAPGVVYLVLGGDLITGEIHEELAKTNDLLSIPAVRKLSQCIVAGVEMLLAAFPCQIKVISVPGNHGRTTHKPEAKGFAVNSYDTLVAWCVESWFAAKGEKRVSFSAPASGDALVSINGWNVLFTHGDRIGSRGGSGFVGPAATAARGMQRLIADYAAEGVVVDYVVIGHFHTPLELEQGFVNSSLAGPSEYSRSGRFKSHPASQWMLTVHPRYGIARRWKIHVGEPSEGSIYRGRAA